MIRATRARHAPAAASPKSGCREGSWNAVKVSADNLQAAARAGKTVAPNLDYDLSFIPVVMVIEPIRIGMCTEAVGVAPAESGTLLPGAQ